MASQNMHTVVGGVVLAAAVGFAIYAVQVAGVGKNGDRYPLTASFRSAEGVNAGTDVRMAGVKIGTVRAVTLNVETYRADMTVALSKEVPIPDDSTLVIASEGLLGGNFVEVVPGGSDTYFNSGDTIEDTQGAISLISLLLKFVGGQGEE